MSKPYFLSSEIPNASPEEGFFHVIPAPYEKSVSYGSGTALGPRSIITASDQLELWDGKSRPADLGIHTAPVINCDGEDALVIDRIANITSKTLRMRKMPIILGGEHSVTWGVIKAYLEQCDGKPDFGVVQVDAHADLRHAYEGNPFSHASVMKRVVEQGVPLFQLGVRAYCEEEIEARKAHGVHYIDADKLVPDQTHVICLPDDFPQKVFFTLDIDGIDPSVFPSTGTPVPGGLSWYQTLSLFESVASQREIIGFDMVEFAPIESFHAYDFAAAQLVYKMMGIVQRHLKR